MEVREASANYDVLAAGVSEVPAGYKQTEVGVIPEDWDVAGLGTLARSIRRGASPRPIDDPIWFDETSSIGWVRISDVTQSGRYLLETTQRLSAQGVRHSRYLPSGALIMSICATVGRPIETRIEVCIHDGFVVFEQPFVDQGFLYHVLKDLEPRWSSKGQTGSQMNLNTALIKSTHIPLPQNKAEQKAIADALSDADALIESLEQLLAKKRQIKQGTMQELLTGKKRLPGFRRKWESKSLGELGVFLKGSGVARDQAQSGSLPCVRYGEIYTTHHEYVRNFTSWISADVAATATAARKGDVLFAGSGETKAEIGKCVALVDDITAYAGGDIVIFRPSDTDPLFLGYALNTPQVNRQKASRGQGDAVVHISATALAEVLVDLPSIDEQIAIAGILFDMDAELGALETSLAKSRRLKQGLMQELLTGRVRLVEPTSMDA